MNDLSASRAATARPDPASSLPALSIRDLRKTYDTGVQALKGVSLDVRPGETTAHTLTLPTGTLRVTVPEGADVKVDGASASGSPSEGLSVSIGSHEITATHPTLGERRASVDVRQGAPAEVTLQFEP